MISHFNAGNVWGRIISAEKGKSQKGVPYVWIKIDCSGEHGSFYVSGRMWGAEKVDGLISHFKKNPAETIRFRGFMEQFTKKVAYWNFTFYSWEPATGKPHKAAFVLRGEVTGTGVETVGDREDGRVGMHLRRPGKNDYPDIEEDVDIFIAAADRLRDVLPGQMWEFKGYISQGGGEDEFGMAGGMIRPYIKWLGRVNEAARGDNE